MTCLSHANLHGFAKKALDGWQLSTIMTFQSGFPAPVTSNIDTTGTGISSRPDLVPASAATCRATRHMEGPGSIPQPSRRFLSAASELRPAPMPSGCRASRT